MLPCLCDVFYVFFCSQLCPSDTDIVESFKRELSDAKSYVRKLAVVQLSEKGKDDKEDKEPKVTQVRFLVIDTQ